MDELEGFVEASGRRKRSELMDKLEDVVEDESTNIVEVGKKRNIGKSEELVEMDEAKKMRKWIKSKRKKKR